MEIYRHNEVYGQPPAPPQKKSPVVWVALALAIAAFLLALVSLIVTLVRPTQPQPPTYAEAFERVRGSVAEVYGDSENGWNAAGSGVIYKLHGGKTYVLTNYHVTSSVGTAMVRFSEYGDKIRGTVLGYDTYHDIALIEIDGTFGTPCASAASPRIGDEVLAVGNNLGYGIAAFDGVVSRTNRLYRINDGVTSDTAKTVPVYAVTAPVNAGMSGGGLFTLQGEIVGINTYQTHSVESGTRPVDGVSYTVPFCIAQKLAERILAEKSGEQVSRIAVEGNNRIEDEIDFFGLYFTARFTEAGLRVNGVTYAEPPAELAGAEIKEGDIVTAIGDLPVTAQTCFADIFAECLRYAHDPSADLPTLKVQLRRGDESMTVEYLRKKLKY